MPSRVTHDMRGQSQSPMGAKRLGTDPRRKGRVYASRARLAEAKMHSENVDFEGKQDIEPVRLCILRGLATAFAVHAPCHSRVPLVAMALQPSEHAHTDS